MCKYGVHAKCGNGYTYMLCVSIVYMHAMYGHWYTYMSCVSMVYMHVMCGYGVRSCYVWVWICMSSVNMGVHTCHVCEECTCMSWGRVYICHESSSVLFPLCSIKGSLSCSISWPASQKDSLVSSSEFWCYRPSF